MFPLNVNVQICAIYIYIYISLTVVTMYGIKTNIVIHYHNAPLQYRNEYI